VSESYIPAGLRREVADRAHQCCEDCRVVQGIHTIDFAIDHVIAQKHGGQTVAENPCFSCYWCSSYKGSDLSSVDWAAGGQIVPLFNPRQQRWDDHFTLKRAVLQALTATGRVTIFLLRLNAPERIEERELLLRLNIYPCV
jgi:hypothetical protein